MKIANTKELLVLNEHAIAANYNRSIQPDALADTADPDGLHIVNSVMVHEHAAGIAVDPHLRCRIMIKIRGQEEPWEGWIDISFDDYNALTDAEPADALVTDFVHRWNATLR